MDDYQDDIKMLLNKIGRLEVKASAHIPSDLVIIKQGRISCHQLESIINEIDHLKSALETAEHALEIRGYKKSCDIPACNCGDQWTHGGHAERQLGLLHEKLELLGEANKEAHARAEDAYLAGMRDAARLADDCLSERLKLNTGQQVNAAIHTRDWIVNKLRERIRGLEERNEVDNAD